MERGKSPPPPTAEKLADLASAVGVTPDSSEWSEFSARAFAARGEVPPDLTVDSNIVGKLPVLYRRLRGEQVDAEDLEDLIRLIRDA
jgi:transcriptional regulator with XRE-family HTH domain